MRHFDAHAYRTEDFEGVKDFARGCMRTYLILKEKAARYNADPEIQGLLSEIKKLDKEANKARLQQYEELASEAQQDKIVQNEIVIPPAPRLGNDVVIAKGLKKAYGDKVLIDGLDFALPLTFIAIVVPMVASRALLLAALTAGSWVYGTLSTWIGERDKNRGWEILADAKRAFDGAAGGSRIDGRGGAAVGARGTTTRTPETKSQWRKPAARR